MKKKDLSLASWANILMIGWIILFGVVLILMYRFSIDHFRLQEIKRESELLQMQAENTDVKLQSLENCLYQMLGNSSEDLVRLETGIDRTKVFMARQSMTRLFGNILGWNNEIFLLTFYIPSGKDPVFLRADSRAEDSNLLDQLSEEMRSFVDAAIEQGDFGGKMSFMTEAGGEGYLVRIYKIRNSYVGIIIQCSTILRSLEGIAEKDVLNLFLCDGDGVVREALFENEVDQVSLVEDDHYTMIEGKGFFQQLVPSSRRDFYLGAWTNSLYVEKQLYSIRLLFIGFVSGALLLMSLLTVWIRHISVSRVRRITTGMKKLSTGEWDCSVQGRSRIREYNWLTDQFNEMISEIRELTIDNYEKELEAQKASLQYLQLQVNPHFYLNVLNIIYSLAEVGDDEKIQEVTTELVKYSRYTFRDPTVQVTVREEMEHVDNYIRIQQIRYPGKVEYQSEISAEIEEAVIPPFIIQSFVENSIKYGISADHKTRIFVKGRINEIGDDLTVQLEITDNGGGYSQEILREVHADGWRPDGKGNHTGINNVMQRLNLVFGNRATMVLKNEGGAKTMINIPLVWEE